MIRPPGMIGVAFTAAADGDQRADSKAKDRVAIVLGIGSDWASVRQVHGNKVLEASHPGVVGEGDALWTRARGLPVAVFTADCFGVVLIGPGAAGVAHVGWRGAISGVVPALRSAMEKAGHPPSHAAIGPGIGSCCFEVGDEVAAEFEGPGSRTTWGSVSVDLRSSISADVSDLEVWASGSCTRHETGWYSHRRDATPSRLAALGWLP